MTRRFFKDLLLLDQIKKRALSNSKKGTFKKEHYITKVIIIVMRLFLYYEEGGTKNILKLWSSSSLLFRQLDDQNVRLLDQIVM